MGSDASQPSLRFEVTYPVTVSTDPQPRAVGEGEWVQTALDVGWRVRRSVGPSIVAVNGPGEFDDDARALLDSLVVVSRDALPVPPVDRDGPMTEVASFEFEGSVYTYDIVGSPAYACTRVRVEQADSQGTCGPFPVTGDVFATFTSGGGYTIAEDSDVIDASSFGAVRNDVARIEVEFIDGTVVTVVPMNASDVFPELRFWVAAAEVAVTEGRSFENSTPVAELRAFDADGLLLDTSRPGDESD